MCHASCGVVPGVGVGGGSAACAARQLLVTVVACRMYCMARCTRGSLHDVEHWQLRLLTTAFLSHLPRMCMKCLKCEARGFRCVHACVFPKHIVCVCHCHSVPVRCTTTPAVHAPNSGVIPDCACFCCILFVCCAACVIIAGLQYLVVTLCCYCTAA